MPIRVGYPGPARRVRFLTRPNRFLASVAPLHGGPEFSAHVPNPGRMEELLVAGVSVGYAVPARPGTDRRTRWDLVAVRHGRTLVSIDAGVANRLVSRTLGTAELSGYGAGPWVPEPKALGSRFDFGVRRGSGWSDLLEVKSSNLRVGRAVLFPDAPTARGTRQLLDLARAARTGVRAHVLFAVQRKDVTEFRPNAALDPAFARALAAASAAGVTVAARCLDLRPDSVGWGESVPVRPPWVPPTPERGPDGPRLRAPEAP